MSENHPHGLQTGSSDGHGERVSTSGEKWCHEVTRALKTFLSHHKQLAVWGICPGLTAKEQTSCTQHHEMSTCDVSQHIVTLTTRKLPNDVMNDDGVSHRHLGVTLGSDDKLSKRDSALIGLFTGASGHKRSSRKSALFRHSKVRRPSNSQKQ